MNEEMTEYEARNVLVSMHFEPLPPNYCFECLNFSALTVVVSLQTDSR